MSEALERVLRLVEEGRLSAEEAAPILDALAGRPAGAGDAPGAEPERRPATHARIEVYERGKKRIDLRVPATLGRLGLDRIPGLTTDQIDTIRAAIDANRHGPILDVEDPDGSGVRIVLD